jgi:hypothetical protein
MRDTPGRQLQLDFQRRAPELCTDCSDPAARASSALHDARLTSATGTGLGCRRCLPIRTAAPAASGTPHPLPRRRVNDAGFNASSEHLRSRSAAASPSLGFHRAPAWPDQPRHQPQPTACPNEHDHTHRLLQSTLSPSTLANDRYPAPRRFSRRSVAPCGAPAMRNRTDRSGLKSAPCKHGSRLWYPTWTSQSPAPAPLPWRVTECSGASLGPPRERRANGQTLGNEPGCLSS